MILTNAAAKRDFYLIHFDVKMSPATRCPRRQNSRVKLSGVKSVASSCPASSRSRKLSCFVKTLVSVAKFNENSGFRVRRHQRLKH